MNCEILSVGTELLLGNILNTNEQFLSERLAQIGISVYYRTTVGDNEDRLARALAIAFSRSDIVIATGGLGPTEDDLTKEVGAEFFNRELIEDEASMANILEHFNAQGYVMTENNKKQALIPEGGIAVKNDRGTAPGIILEDSGKTLIILPGPPSEMEYMFDMYIMPYLSKLSDNVFVSKTLKICGIGESAVETMIKDLLHGENPTVAPYAKPSEVWLRITAMANSVTEGISLCARVMNELYGRLGDNIYGVDDDSLESVVVRMLKESGKTLAVSESCTGGMLTARLVSVPGVSDVLLEGVVTYSNESKVLRLGVKQETLDEFGAVSEETAKEMAEGVAKSLGANIGVSTTGIAGPEGGTKEKPVGLCYIGLYIDGEVYCKKVLCKGDREKIRQRTATLALDYLRRTISPSI